MDRWKEQRIWDAVLEDIEVVVSTHAVLADALSHGFVKLARLALVIFDEGKLRCLLLIMRQRSLPCHNSLLMLTDFHVAHHCNRKHPANKIMQNFYHSAKAEGTSVPHILGLSASPILRSKISELQCVAPTIDCLLILADIGSGELSQL